MLFHNPLCHDTNKYLLLQPENLKLAKAGKIGTNNKSKKKINFWKRFDHLRPIFCFALDVESTLEFYSLSFRCWSKGWPAGLSLKISVHKSGIRNRRVLSEKFPGNLPHFGRRWIVRIFEIWKEICRGTWYLPSTSLLHTEKKQIIILTL